MMSAPSLKSRAKAAFYLILILTMKSKATSPAKEGSGKFVNRISDCNDDPCGAFVCAECDEAEGDRSSAHTAGLWHVCFSEIEEVYGGARHYAVSADSENGGQILADVEGDLTPEAEANAYLMAAAPELLDTLKAINGDCERWLNDEVDCTTDLFAAFLDETAAAIAKAENKNALTPGLHDVCTIFEPDR